MGPIIMEKVVRVENIGKSYLVGHRNRIPSPLLRDTISHSIKKIVQKIKNPLKTTSYSFEEFWALQNINFEIEKGTKVGVIGRNGAGKSTLLKILSRITSPTTGYAEIHGKVATLLEVGTGFHPELTGRENIFLNGAILGMKRKETQKIFSDIVEFSGVEKFLDTPVKRYSSGMYIRLAFAVAAHLDPEIFLVDEVLAVGDVQFQKKCLGKMQEVSRHGRTVFLISHNIHAIENLCNYVILLENGKIKMQSKDVRVVIDEYLSHNTQISVWQTSSEQFDNPYFKPLRFYVGDRQGQPLQIPIRNDTEMVVYMEGEIEKLNPAISVGYAVYNERGTCLYQTCFTDKEEKLWPKLQLGKNILYSTIPCRFLNEGSYRIEMVGIVHPHRMLFIRENAPTFNIQIEGGLSNSPYWTVRRYGELAPEFSWDIR